MKKNSAWLFLSMFVIAVACKDDDSPATNSITSEEAAVFVSSAISSEGLGAVTGTVAQFSTDLLDENTGGRKASCGISDEFSITGDSDEGSELEYSFDFAYEYKLACEGNVPATLAFDLNYSGDLKTDSASLDYSGLAKLDLTGLQKAAKAFAMNGTFKRNGSIVDIKKNKTLSCDVDLTLDDIMIDKEILEISSGTGTFAIAGSVPDKGNFKFTGTIEYLGSQSAEISVNGVVFVSNLKTGKIKKK